MKITIEISKAQEMKLAALLRAMNYAWSNDEGCKPEFKSIEEVAVHSISTGINELGRLYCEELKLTNKAA